MEPKTREQWVEEYQGMGAFPLQFFLASAKGCLKSDAAMASECEPDKQQMWADYVEQDLLEIEVIESRLAQLAAEEPHDEAKNA